MRHRPSSRDVVGAWLAAPGGVLFRLVLVYLGCVFLGADLLHVQEIGVALPFVALAAIATTLLAIRDAVGANDALPARAAGMRVALLALIACTIVGGIAATVPCLVIVDEVGMHGPYPISDRLAPLAWSGVFALAVRALHRPSPRRLAYVALASSLAWPVLHVIAVFSHQVFFGTREIAHLRAFQCYGGAVYGVALIGVTIGIVARYAQRSPIELTPAIASSAPSHRPPGSRSRYGAPRR